MTRLVTTALACLVLVSFSISTEIAWAVDWWTDSGPSRPTVKRGKHRKSLLSKTGFSWTAERPATCPVSGFWSGERSILWVIFDMMAPLRPLVCLGQPNPRFGNRVLRIPDFGQKT